MVLHFSHRGDFTAFIGSQEAYAHPRAEWQMIPCLKEDAPSGHVARDAPKLAEQMRFDPNRKNFIEAKVSSFLIFLGRKAGQGRGAGARLEKAGLVGHEAEDTRVLI